MILHRNTLIAFGLSVLGASCVAASEPGFRRFADSISPDGAYVLAWGWDGQEKDLQEWVSGADNAEETVANFLVDAARGKILATIPEHDHFVTSDGRWKQFSGLSVSWSADSQHALAIYEGRWSDESILWIIPRDRAFIEIGGQLDTAYRNLLSKKIGLKDAGEVSFSDAALLPDGVLIVDGRARPKVNEAREYNYRLKFQVKIEDTSAKCTLESGRKIAGPSADTDEAASEKWLNKVYGRLRAKLDPAGRAALKEEELLWLKQRDTITGQVERHAFTRHRAVYLQARSEY